jgi:signal recognition particle subunit SRP54
MMKKDLAIISSMTKQEREKIAILNSSRKQRIACGAGVSVQDIDKLLTQFKEMQGFVKLFGKFGKKFQ